MLHHVMEIEPLPHHFLAPKWQLMTFQA